MKIFRSGWFHRMWALLEAPAPDPLQWLRRIESVERDIVLPIKAAGLVMLAYFVFLPNVTEEAASALSLVFENLQYFLWVYVPVSLAGAVVLLNSRRAPLALVQWTVFLHCFVDGVFVAALTLMTGGYDSILYWLFVGLVIRNALVLPPPSWQLILNLFSSVFFVIAGVLEVAVNRQVAADIDPASRHMLDLETENLTEPVVLRVVLLWAVTLCAYGVQVLLERQRRALEDAREFAVRTERLRAAGRLAAEIAHQIKNPLAIINNTVFSLRRALNAGRSDVEQQIGIIQEEVGRSDRILIQLMGYAQLSEGRVEKLSLTEELDRALQQVLPEGTAFRVNVHRDYDPHVPPVFMQRGHLNEVLVNILQNAREAMNGRGNIWVLARPEGEYTIRVSVKDDGPGVAPDKLERIFEAYYTEKEKGTGLGLAIAKHNIELYGGQVTVESELGKGARFVILFPAKTLV